MICTLKNWIAFLAFGFHFTAFAEPVELRHSLGVAFLHESLNVESDWQRARLFSEKTTQTVEKMLVCGGFRPFVTLPEMGSHPHSRLTFSLSSLLGRALETGSKPIWSEPLELRHLPKFQEGGDILVWPAQPLSRKRQERVARIARRMGVRIHVLGFDDRLDHLALGTGGKRIRYSQNICPEPDPLRLKVPRLVQAISP